MKMSICTVFDKKAEVFGRPFYTHNRAVALRSLTEQVNHRVDDNDLSKYPEDFALYFLGEFDDATGHFDLLEIPEKLAEASDLIRPAH